MLERLLIKRDVLLIKPLSIVEISIFLHRYFVKIFWILGMKYEDKLSNPYSFVRVDLIKCGTLILNAFL